MWLKAHTVFLAWCRERRRGLEPLGEAGGDDRTAAGDPHGEVERRLDAVEVLDTVQARLGTEAYECFLLRYESDLALEEVAAIVGRDRKTVNARLRAAHQLIDRLLAKEPRPEGGTP